jgi:hypothetical protein
MGVWIPPVEGELVGLAGVVLGDVDVAVAAEVEVLLRRRVLDAEVDELVGRQLDIATRALRRPC